LDLGRFSYLNIVSLESDTSEIFNGNLGSCIYKRVLLHYDKSIRWHSPSLFALIRKWLVALRDLKLEPERSLL
jgi:hypothetical protein